MFCASNAVDNAVFWSDNVFVKSAALLVSDDVIVSDCVVKAADNVVFWSWRDLVKLAD